MLNTTNPTLTGFRVAKELGTVRGIVVRSRSVIGNIGASIQTLFGGDITLYTELCERARADAYDRMIASAANLGANAILGLRYDATEVMAEKTGGQVLWIAVRSVSPRQVTLTLPWEGPCGMEVAGVSVSQAIFGPEVTFAAEPGRLVVLFPAGHPPLASYSDPEDGGPNQAPKKWNGCRLGLERDF